MSNDEIVTTFLLIEYATIAMMEILTNVSHDGENTNSFTVLVV